MSPSKTPYEKYKPRAYKWQFTVFQIMIAANFFEWTKLGNQDVGLKKNESFCSRK